MYTRILSFIILFLLLACSSLEPISSTKFSGLSVIKKGDTTNISWAFSNADYVEVNKFPQKFKNIDSISVSPELSTVYKIKAINQEDTLIKDWRVIVEIPEIEQIIESSQFETSYSESEYFKGLMLNSKIVSPERLKILSAQIDNQTDQLNFRALVLDKYGNYLGNLTDGNQLTWKISQACNDKTSEVKISDYSEDKLDNRTSHMSFLIDVSASAENNAQVLDKIRDFSAKCTDKDLLSLYKFDHEFENEIDPTDKNEFIKYLKRLNNRRGLNAIYMSLFKQINDIKDQKNNAIILINYSSNNAATIYNISDVIKESRNNQIPVYVISIGNSHDSFSMKYLAYGCGGKYYNIQANELYKLDDIITEIYFANKSAYTFKIPLSALSSCNYDAAKVQLVFNDQEYQDDIYFVKSPEWLGNRSQVIANFSYQETKLDPQFYGLVESLSRLLNDNPGIVVELVGHSSIEGSSDNNMELSYSRAQNVQAKLFDYGVNSDQLKLRAEANQTPLFPLPNSSWQQQYNRRVELRWLLPEVLPYEIVTDERWTEKEAIAAVDTWRQRGYRSYYQRFLIDGLPKYKVKLWGYETEDQARELIKIIGKKYKTKARIE